MNGTYQAYFDGTPKFYGIGATRQEAIQDLADKIYAVLKAVGYIQKGM